MNFKRYHESRNLFIQKLTGATIDSLGAVVSDANYDTYIAEVSDGETYTVSNVTGTQVFGFFTTKPTLGTITYNSSRTIFSTSSRTLTVPTGENIKYIGVRYNTSVSDAMLNTGSQPLPYEPYSSEVWHNISHYIMGTSTDTITTLPSDLYPNAVTATVGLKGNTTQNGTPTPTAPIQPQECGERTGNLWGEDYPNIKVDTPTYRSIYVGDGTFTLSTTAAQYRVSANLFFLAGNVGSGASTQNNGVWNGNPRTVTTVDGYVTIAYRYYTNDEASDPRSNDVMLNLGSTPLPYEPYGYKIPISSANTTTNVYLGEVETTRKIRKLVLTGEESWANVGGNAPYRLTINDIAISSSTASIEWYCSHYQSLSTGDSWASYDYCISRTSTTAQSLQFRDVTKGDITAFKQYLAAQYANGTPVTIWYVLATPTTGMVNEPLRKIGDYADTVSGITIPTIAGANSFDVLTTLKPSEVTVNYKGWHPVADVHERENGAWT